MKKIVTAIALLCSIQAFSQQKSQVFIDAGVNVNATKESQTFKTLTGSVIYSYAPKSKFGIGAGLVVGQLQTGYSVNEAYVFKRIYKPVFTPTLDFRYYMNFKRNSFFPVVQAGYNVYNKEANQINSSSSYHSEMHGAGQYAAGFGYSRTIFGTRGVFVMARYTRQEFNYKSTLTQIQPSTSTTNYSGKTIYNGGALTLGFRF